MLALLKRPQKCLILAATMPQFGILMWLGAAFAVAISTQFKMPAELKALNADSREFLRWLTESRVRP